MEDEWSWSNLIKSIFKSKFKGFFALESQSKLKIFKTKVGSLGEEWEFKRDYDPVFLYVDTEKTAEVKQNTTEKNKGKKGFNTQKESARDEYPSCFKINYVTKNCIQWLGWESRDLINKNITTIIPQPFKNFHDQYMDTSNLNGSILMHKSVRPIVCEQKDGSLYPVEIGIRLGMSIDHGFQFIAVMNFIISNKIAFSDDLVLSIDDKGKIIQCSKSTNNYLTKITPIDQQLTILHSILPQFDYITALKHNNE
jgi:PAS domain S-box-containing protein